MQRRLPRLIIAGRPTRAGWLATGAALAALTGAAVPAAQAAGTSAPTSPATAAAAKLDGIAGTHIKHVIEIMIENHSFDNLFGSFPGADGIPPSTSMLNPNAYFDSMPNVSPVKTFACARSTMQ